MKSTTLEKGEMEKMMSLNLCFQCIHNGVITTVVFEFDRLVGKVASDNSHKWVYSDSKTEHDPTFISSWNVSIEPVRKYLKSFSSPFSLLN